MPLIRKERAGSDSFGNTWPEDGATVEVEAEHAGALLAIPDGGFSEVTPDGDGGPDEKTEISEVDPDKPTGEPETEDFGDQDESKTPAKKTAARKTTARKSVEEG